MKFKYKYNFIRNQIGGTISIPIDEITEEKKFN